MRLQATPADFAAALAATGREDAASLPLLDPSGVAALLASTRSLDYRAARPLVGGEGREVRQDFELTMEIPEGHPVRGLADALTALANAARALLPEDPLPAAVLPGGLRFNDLIVQRYGPGSAGITPHRDHLRYVGLVVLVTLAGEADLVLLSDRQGSDPRRFPMAPGVATLMRAPGFGGSPERPFHRVTDLREPRVSIGLRHDTRPGEPT